jgi:hypothetical protein
MPVIVIGIGAALNHVGPATVERVLSIVTVKSVLEVTVKFGITLGRHRINRLCT